MTPTSRFTRPTAGPRRRGAAIFLLAMALTSAQVGADEPPAAGGGAGTAATSDAPAANATVAPADAAPSPVAQPARPVSSVPPVVSPAKEGVTGVVRTPESTRWHMRYAQTLKRNWGIELETVRPVSSGYMLEMRYRILDAEKAMPLMEKKAKPYLIDEATGTRLMVPAMENIGELRQTPRPTEGRLYYIIFGNPGKLVKRGGLVTVVIGNFRAEGLVVD
jgi:hypothetical protein